jgi:hypothetical protein
VVGRQSLRHHHINIPEILRLASLDDRTARSMATVILAIADGIALQWLFDTDHPPTGSGIAEGVTALAEQSG